MNKRQKIANIMIKNTMLLIIGIFLVISFVTYGYASTSTEGGGTSEAKTVTTTTTSSTNNFSSKVSTNSDGYSGILGITEVTNTSYQEDEGSFEDITLSKTATGTADGYAKFLLTYTETGWVQSALEHTDTPSIPYSDADGYSGTLYKTSAEKTGESGEAPSDPSIGDTYIHTDYYTANYSGIVTKNVTVWVPDWITVTQFTAEYNGTAYTEVVFQANLASPTNGQCVGEPVNIITGNYYSTDIDMSIQDLGQDMEVKRYYNSRDKKTGLLGTGWRINYDSNIVTDITSGNETVTYPDGHAIVFKPIVGTNTYMSPETVFDELIKNSDGTYTLKLQNKYRYNYGTNKKLISITERNGNQLTIQYDTLNNIISVTGSNGNILSFTYENGKIKTIKDQTNRTITYVYDSNNNLIEVHGLGGVTKYSYNSFGLASATDENNKTYIQNEYDEFGRIIRQKDEKLNITEYSYDDANMENTYTVQTTGKVEKYKYNAEMYITKITYSDNTYEEYTYGLYGNREAVRNRNGNTTTYTYDARGNILTETSPAPLSYIKTYIYDANDNIVEVSTTGGMVTTFEYDTKSNLIWSHVKLDEITQATTEYTYDLYGRLILEKDAEGNTINYGYEGNNSMPSSSTDPEGNVLSFSYDSLGRRTSITTEYGTTSLEYNQQNKIIKVIDPANNITRMKYDAVGNLTKLIKPEQYSSSTDDGTGYTYSYDAMDRLLKQIDPLGNASVVKYNQDGDKIKEINPNFYDSATDDGTGYSYVYDGNNRPIKVTNPSGQQARIFYDGVGNITKIIDANNYDESTDSGPAMQYTYDILNRLVEIRDTSNNVIKRMVYDADGRVIKQIDAKGYNSGSNDDERYGTVYKYNLAGWMTEKRVPLKNENDTIYYNVTRCSYDKAGKLLSEKKSQQYATLTGEPTQWNEINYTYYMNGNIKTITDSTGAYIEYSYDSLGNTVQQKAKINDTKYSITGYHYDSLGRLDKEWKEIDASDLTGDGTGVVLAETSYQYDKNGNIIKITSPEGYITNFAYDLSGRMIEKNQSVPKDQIYVIRSTASITSPRKITYPGKQYQYKVEIQPDTQINEVNLEIEYDARIMELVTATPNEAGITINTDTIGKIIISTVDKAYITKAELAQLTFNINNQNQGTGYITICPTSNYKNGQGEVYKFTELNGKTNIVKEPDMNNDNKVETNDFTLTALQNSINNTSPQYDEKYDIDGDGIVDVPDLDYIKDWLFAEPQQQLNKLDILRFTEKTTEAIYSKIQSFTDRVISYQYDKAGNIVQETDSNGYVTNLDYDSYNRLIRVTDKEGSKSRIFYDEVGNIIKQVQPDNYDITTDNGLGTVYEYDSINRLLTAKDEQGNVIQKNIYDIYGQLVKVIDAAGYQASTTDTGRYGIEYTYDIGNRVSSIITPIAKLNSMTSESYDYDAMNNVITNTDGEGNVTHYLRNQWGKITNVTDAKSVNTLYTYDYAGNLTSVTDGKNNTTNYSYNSLNLLSTITDAAGHTITYKYDKEGRMRAETDRNGTTILYDYNIDNNLISKKTSTGSLEELYLYNKDGSLLAAINSEMVDTFEYTPNSYLKTKARNGKILLDYQYNKNGNVSKVTDSLGNITAYTYDTIGRMQKVLDGTTQIAEYSYNIDSTISQINYNNGVNANYAYDRDKNITSLINQNQNGTTISSFAYTYDNNGNQLTKVENEQTTTYTYDQLNRLAQVQYPGSVQENFEFDNAGNRTKKTTGAITTDYVYDQLNRLTQSTENATLTTYSYDDNGNQLEKVEGGQTTQYIYNAFNRQTEVNMPDGTWQANKYDAFGMRLAVLENGVRYDFTTDRGNVITETNASGEQVARSIRGIDLVAQEDVKGNLSYYLHNAHGDVVNMVDAAGNVLNSYSYDAFGNTTSYAEKVVNRFLYSGEQLDKLTGDYYLRARYYDPAIGRFTQEDTYRGKITDPQSLNLYSYVMNNPVKYVDPSGHRAAMDGEGSYSAKPLPSKPDTKTNTNSTSTTSTKCDVGNSGQRTGQSGTSFWNDVKNTFKEIFSLPKTEEGQIAFAFALCSSYSRQIEMDMEDIQAECSNIYVEDDLDITTTVNKRTGKTVINFGSDTKSTQKLSNQMTQRGWTESTIRDTVSSSNITRVSTNKATGNPATVYYNKAGGYVIIDNTTKAVVQVSDNINPSTWIPDPSIINPYKP